MFETKIAVDGMQIAVEDEEVGKVTQKEVYEAITPKDTCQTIQQKSSVVKSSHLVHEFGRKITNAKSRKKLL